MNACHRLHERSVPSTSTREPALSSREMDSRILHPHQCAVASFHASVMLVAAFRVMDMPLIAVEYRSTSGGGEVWSILLGENTPRLVHSLPPQDDMPGVRAEAEAPRSNGS